MLLLLIFILSFQLITLGIFLLLLTQALKSFFLRRAPFIPTRAAVVPKIIEALNLKQGDMLYDLGCGDGRILRAAVASAPGTRGVGIDNAFIPLFFARQRTKGLPISIRSNNLFKISLSDATHIYCYLLTDVLAKLEPKIITECRPGTRIITCDFQFPTLIPKEEINLLSNKNQLAKKLYVYEI